MQICCVVDNHVPFSSKYYGEHGFSLLIKDSDETLLFDSGTSPLILKHNLELMGINNNVDDAKTIHKLIISHGHFDHTGGIYQLTSGKDTPVLIHPKAFLPKYKALDGNLIFIGIPGINGNHFTSNSNQHTSDTLKYPSKFKSDSINFQKVAKTKKIGPKMWIFSDVPLINHLETIDPALLVRKDDKLINDTFEDEQNLVIKTDDGLIVISGCAHRGIINIITAVEDYFNDEICGVIGGTHLANAPEKRIEMTVQELKKRNLKILALGHCTGLRNLCMFQKEFGDIFSFLSSGKMILNDIEI